MAARIRAALIPTIAALTLAFCAYAQLRPEVTVKPKPRKPPAAKVTPKPAEKPAAKPQQPQKPPEPEPAQIVVETSPNAEVYLDDQFVGRASPEGRLVIGNPAPGSHSLRVVHPAYGAFEKSVSVTPGEIVNIKAEVRPEASMVQQGILQGVRVENFTPASRPELGYATEPGGVLVTEVPSLCAAARAGLKVGYVIRSLNGYPTNSVDDFLRVAVNLDESATLRVQDERGTPGRIRVGR